MSEWCSSNNIHLISKIIGNEIRLLDQYRSNIWSLSDRMKHSKPCEHNSALAFSLPSLSLSISSIFLSTKETKKPLYNILFDSLPNKCGLGLAACWFTRQRLLSNSLYAADNLTAMEIFTRFGLGLLLSGATGPAEFLQPGREGITMLTQP